MYVIKEILRLTLFLIILSLSCSRGVSLSIQNDELIVDIISIFDKAKIEDKDFKNKLTDLNKYNKIYKDPWSTNSLRLVKVGFELDKNKMFQNIRRSIYLGAYKGSPCKISVPLNIDSGKESFLSFAVIGLNLNQKITEKELCIRLIDEDRNNIIYKTQLQNFDKEWSSISLDLPRTRFESPAIEIGFKTNSEEYEHIFISNPRIFKRKSRSKKFSNVIFISIDALRTDAVGSITDKYDLTPNIDSIARDGMTFSNHFVVSNWTRPSTIAMLASAYASSTGLNLYYPPISDEEKSFFYYKSGLKLISSILKEYGYITRSIGNNSFMIDYTGIGVDLDFDELSEYQTQWEDTIDITEETIDWLRKNWMKRFFLFINYNAPHNDYIPPKKYLTPLQAKYKNIDPKFRAYLGEVSYTDDYFGRILNELKQLNIYNHTIVVITSDHGEIFSKEHKISPFTDTKSIYTHGQTQLDEELRVPLVIKPSTDSHFIDINVNAQVRSIDIAPTILELLNLPIPASCHGKSLLHIILGKENDERVVYSEGRMMFSVRADGFKYAERFYGFGIRPHHWGGKEVIEYKELYNLIKDPYELENIVDLEPDIAIRMYELLRKMRFKQPSNILLSKGIDIQGRLITYNGFFYDIETFSKNSQVERITRREYKFKLLKNESLVFQTIPKDAKFAVYILNNKEKLLTGRYLLPLVKCFKKGVYIIDPSIDMIQGEPLDEVMSLIDKGILFWNIPLKSGIRNIRGKRYLSRDINILLQKWGYIQGKEKNSRI